MIRTEMSVKFDNWYYVQVFHEVVDGRGLHRTIVFASSPVDAEHKVRNWAKSCGFVLKDTEGHKYNDSSVVLYHKNYKIEARKMVEAGNYID